MSCFDILFIALGSLAVMCGIQVIRLDNRLRVKREMRLKRLKNKFK